MANNTVEVRIQGDSSRLERAINTARDAINQFGNAGSQASRRLQQSMNKVRQSITNTNSKFQELKNSIDELDFNDVLGGSAVFTVLGDAISEVINKVEELQGALSKIQGATGASDIDMQSMGTSFGNVYATGAGNDWNDVASAMSVAKQMTGQMGEELENVTQGALVVRDAFDIDINESVRAADSLMKQFGVTGEEAYTLMAQAAQNGANKNGDLADTLNEYAVQFKQLGFTAEEFTNTLITGAQNGSFSIDKVGDAVKEFNIRVKDGSKSTTEGFEALGMNADEMAQRFTAGGDTAKQAFKETMTALANMDDPVEQNIAGVNLWGTMWEDLGAQGVLALANISDKADMTADTLSKLQIANISSIGGIFDYIGRQIETAFILPLIQEAMPALKDFASFLTKFFASVKRNGLAETFKNMIPPEFQIALGAIAGIFGGVLVASIAGIVAVAAPLAGIFASAVAAAAPIIGMGALIGAGIAIAISAFEALDDKFHIIDTIVANVSPTLDELKATFDEVFNNIIASGSNFLNKFSEFIDAISPITEPILEILIAVFEYGFSKTINIAIETLNTFLNVLGDIVTGIIDLFSGIVTFFTGVFTGDFETAWEGITQIFSAVLGTLGNVITDLFEGFKNTFNTAFGEIISAVTQWVNDIYNSIVNGLNNIVNSASETWEQFKQDVSNAIDETIEAIEEFPNNIAYCIGYAIGYISTLPEKASEAFDELVSYIEGLPDRFLEMVDNVISYLMTLPSACMEAGSEFISSAEAWVSETYNTVVNKITELISEIQSVLSQAPSVMIEAGNQVVSATEEWASNAYNKVVEWVNKIPSAISEAISNAASTVRNFIDGLTTNFTIGVQAGGGGDVTANHNAKGGIYSQGAFLTYFAEDSAEAAIPIDGSNRAKALWTKTGEMLGMFRSGNAEGLSIANSISGNSYSSSIETTAKADVIVKTDKALSDIEKLNQKIKDLQNEGKEVSPNLYTSINDKNETLKQNISEAFDKTRNSATDLNKNFVDFKIQSNFSHLKGAEAVQAQMVLDTTDAFDKLDEYKQKYVDSTKQAQDLVEAARKSGDEKLLADANALLEQRKADEAGAERWIAQEKQNIMQDYFDEQVASYKNCKDIQAEIDEAYNDLNLERLQEVLTEENAIRLNNMEAQKEMMATYQEVFLAANATNAQLTSDLYSTVYDSLNDNIKKLIMGTQSWGDAIKNLGQSLIQTVINFYAQKIAAMLTASLMGDSMQASSATASTALAAEQAAAWSTAALFKEMVMPGTGAIALASLTASSVGAGAISAIPALANGGITKGATVAMIGEGRYQEAVMPLNRAYFEKAGLIDKKGESGGNHYTISINAVDTKGFDKYLKRTGGKSIAKELTRQAFKKTGRGKVG